MRDVSGTPSAGTSSECIHGGASFEDIGTAFDDLDRRHRVINADVLDAWFPPAPSVLEALRENLDWLASTSAPTNCDGLIRTIAEVRGISAQCILPGAGSSDLIYRALAHWLSPAAHILVLDPGYGEYPHLGEKVLGCRVDRFPLDRRSGYRLDPGALQARLATGRYDLAVIVNPNNPTGQHVPREALEKLAGQVPLTTLLWIDEGYVDYAGPGQSMERFAAQRPNLVVCKSLGEAYALSGMRAAYLCGAAENIAQLRRWTPSWVIGLPAQVAAVKALQAAKYYQGCYRQTRELRRQLADGLRHVQPHWDILEGEANFVLCQLPTAGPTAATLADRFATRGLFVRDVAEMGVGLGQHVLRIAVKDAATQERMLAIVLELA